MALRALVIEDEVTIAKQLQKKLERRGHEVTIASNQSQVYHLLGQREFDFVLLDLRLPTLQNSMDHDSEVGFDILDYIRDRFTPKQLPVLVMTAYEVTSQTAVRALRALANDYITKPFEDSRVSLGQKLDALTRAISNSGPTSVLKKRYEIVFSRGGVEINGIPVKSRRHSDILRLLGSRVFLDSGDGISDKGGPIKGKELGDELGLDGATVRQDINRFKSWIAGEHESRGLGSVDRQDVIRNVRGRRGYEINLDTCDISHVLEVAKG